MGEPSLLEQAGELLERASNILHGPLLFLRGTPGHDIHKAAVDDWMKTYEALAEKLEESL